MLNNCECVIRPEVTLWIRRREHARVLGEQCARVNRTWMRRTEHARGLGEQNLDEAN